MKSVAFYNLGCKVNSYELDVMQQNLSEKGYEIVPFSQKADIYIVNTCTVTNMADRKSRQILHRAKKQNPDAIVVAVGCYVQTDPEGATKDASVDLCVGNNRKRDLPEILEQFIKERVADHTREQKTLHGTTIIDINHTYEYEETKLKTTAEHTRAYIKIQDGCNQFCSYCAIPLARGRARSRACSDIMTEIEGVVEAGYREIVLTGIHISSYGIDFTEEEWQQGICKTHENRPEYNGDSKLIDLIEKIHDIPGLERIRIGSLEPRIVTPDVAKRLAALPKVCPHFHLSLQSGCDATLKRMNRHYTVAQYKAGVDALRQVYDKPAITTDVIVGFPGETEEEFAQTKAFLEEIAFYELHVFKYSKRANTRAAKMPDQVSDQVKTIRSDELLRLDRVTSKEYRKKYLDREALVLWEETKEIRGKLYVLGHTPDYVKVACLTGGADRKNRKAGAEDRKYREAGPEGGIGESREEDLPLQGQITTVHIKDYLTEEILLADETDLF